MYRSASTLSCTAKANDFRCSRHHSTTSRTAKHFRQKRGLVPVLLNGNAQELVARSFQSPWSTYSGSYSIFGRDSRIRYLPMLRPRLIEIMVQCATDQDGIGIDAFPQHSAGFRLTLQHTIFSHCHDYGVVRNSAVFSAPGRDLVG